MIDWWLTRFGTHRLRNTGKMRLFSPAQVVGYFALVLGITAFLQKSDNRLKFFNATQGLVYALHFVLLGNLPASASSLVSSARSFLALRYRSLLLGAVIVAVNLGLGAVFAGSAAGWLPVIGSCIATIAIFTMRGVPFRCVLLASTLLWLANNIITGSIGGTLLEVANATVNIWTMIRMVRSPPGAHA
ncbi:MAG: YgjV family protein [Candidatus Solibacter sp.]